MVTAQERKRIPMRIARCVVDDEPFFGVIQGESGAEWVAKVKGDPLYTQVEGTGERYELADVRLLAPVIPRSKVIGIGRNYRDHAAEMGSELPATPLMFLIPNTAVVGPGDPVVIPSFTTNCHYEGELAVVISRMCKDVPAAKAHDVILGYTCANDVTDRDLQKSDGQWSRAKGFDTFCPIGPWIETELDGADIEIRTRLEGRTVQEASTKDLIFDIPTLIEAVSQAFTLLPGDVILTGTPAGVGPVEAGQSVEVEIEGIGSLMNPFVRR
ncbi:TsaD/Kae1/Qri7 protein [Platysternon megacephalum]|uniref:Oxaloacetate tautomerase FAHD1, mitochondrial n=1 Tax=Platysternon megacephalum TaxID=55544 RepID=A0A4D9DDZ8_9SAUR|nr:TsaD/Kae1/Qri7 protein [Platysternon megacephalum]